MFAISFIAVALAAWWVTCLYRQWTTWRLLKKLPHLSSSDRLLGSIELIKDPDKVAHSLLATAKDLSHDPTSPVGMFSFRIAQYQGVVVLDPVLYNKVLSRTLNLPKDPSIYHELSSLTSPGGKHPSILSHLTNDGYWWALRKGVAPAFSPLNIRNEFHHVLRIADQVTEILRASSSQYVDVDNLFQRASMDVIGRIGFGSDFGAIPSWNKNKVTMDGNAAVNAYDIFELTRAAGEEIQMRMTIPFRTQLRWLIPGARRGEAALCKYRQHMKRLLEVIRAKGVAEASVAGHLLKIQDPATGNPLTDEQLASEIGMFFFAGTETTGHTLAWTLYLLATHPKEIDAITMELDGMELLVTRDRPNPRALTYDDLSKLRHLQHCLKESMRLIPVVAGGTARTCTQPIELGGYTIPTGVNIMPVFYAVHRSPANWELPDEFLPARWSVPRADYMEGKSNEDVKRFIPFSIGSRDCVGQSLAKMNMAAQLAVLLSRFVIDVPEKLKTEEALWDMQAHRITLQPKNGMPLLCVPR